MLEDLFIQYLSSKLDSSNEDVTESISASASSRSLQQSSAPLLSPTAEAELLLLATNFLLYVAMVIIVTIVAKVYFPESLKRSENAQNISRSHSYLRVISGDDYVSGDDDEEENNDNDNDNNNSNIDTDSSEEEKATSSSYLEFDLANSSRQVVVKRLAFCSIMLIVTFVAWGVLQERILTRRYPRITGEYFTYSYALVFTNRLWTFIMSGILLLYIKPSKSRSTVIYEYSFPSISNMLSSWCQYEALRYLSFPAATLFKCFKLVPVMIMGKILGNREYPQYDYVVALIIGAGISLFMTSSDELQMGHNIHEQESAKWTGIMLLGIYLFFDSFTGQWQSRMFQRHRDLSMLELLFANATFSSVLSFITLVHSKELWPAVDFIYNHPELHLHFFLFSFCSTVGQLFIFYTIKNFGAVVFTIIMTVRILASIALSCVLYGHQVSATGLLGLTLVMGAVGYRIKRKAEETPLIKWQGMGDEKAVELVQEWHEHLDM